MIDIKKSGYLVEMMDGSLGRTIHEKGMVNGKVPVYKATLVKEFKGTKIPLSFSEAAILCDPEGLKQIGFID
jgi:hypothetical protein